MGRFFLASIAGVAALALLVASAALAGLDAALALALQAAVPASWETPLLIATYAGSLPAMGLLAGGLGLMVAGGGYRLVGLFVPLLWIGLVGLEIALQRFVYHPTIGAALNLTPLGPGDADGLAAYTFPSGHAARSAYFALLVGALLFDAIDSRVIRLGLGVLLTGGALAVGLSRIYLARHWPSDVLGGYLLGLALALLLLLLARAQARTWR